MVPSPLPNNPRCSGDDHQRDYALSVLLPLKKHDRTGWVLIYEQATRQAAGAIWDGLPQQHVCSSCLAYLSPTRAGLRPLPCGTCGVRRPAVTLRGIVAADIRRVKAALRQGGIAVG